MRISLFLQTWRLHWKSLASWAAVLVGMNAIELSVYPSMSKSTQAMQDFLESFPEFFKKMFRMEDYFSGAGFLNTELFSLIIPMVMIGVGLAWGASATAEDEERGTAELLLTLPVKRSVMLWSRFAATVSALTLLAVLNFLSLFWGAQLVDMSLTFSKLSAATLASLLIGITFSSLGLLLGAVTGKKSVSLGIGAGAAILLYLFYTISAIVSRFDFIRPINPFEWLIDSNQLIDGFNLNVNLKFVLVAAVSIGSATVIFNRKDIHSS